ncbi:uncharacterized protein LOC114728849 [Neltuma alba]|uniref:uncharacterized protein LOC114728849 n=1 Tax=Neltuma alba TaxID=207710 RepID=UPI0010A30628|nr:uncharacterized protein LOC114728849 [Prosopis alba]
MEQNDIERTEEAHFTGNEQPHADANAVEEEEEEQVQGNENPHAEQRPAPRRQAGFDVEFEDSEGNRSYRKLTVKELSMMTSGRVVVPLNELGQPTKKGGQLYNKYVHLLGQQWMLFPIYVQDWKKIILKKKQQGWEMMKSKFILGEELRADTIKRLGVAWKNRRADLWRERKGDGTRPLQEILADVPGGVPKQDWFSYVYFRMSADQRALSARNAGSGEKTQQERGYTPTYGEMWPILYRPRDGRASDEVEKIATRMTHVDTKLHESQGSALDPTASLLVGCGRTQHPNRVSGLGLRPTPTRLSCSGGAGPSYTAESSLSTGAKRPSSSSSEELREELRQELEASMKARVEARIRERDRQLQERDAQFQLQVDQFKAAVTAMRDVLISMVPNISIPKIPDIHLPPVPPLPPISQSSPSTLSSLPTPSRRIQQRTMTMTLLLPLPLISPIFIV